MWNWWPVIPWGLVGSGSGVKGGVCPRLWKWVSAKWKASGTQLGSGVGVGWLVGCVVEELAVGVCVGWVLLWGLVVVVMS
ncbi:hypothetical protein NRB20_75490 [Nocardia sp. RB20]|uniref:Transmembrane protein n=1 Tax=Nocardia macrotermitis TaxID=2585198 RepID=A0A7K0DI00_9NOCA|nr:hypothetical protein [Nocardia macrotermitis]